MENGTIWKRQLFLNFRDNLSYLQGLLKLRFLSQARWCMSAIPTLLEVETGSWGKFKSRLSNSVTQKDPLYVYVPTPQNDCKMHMLKTYVKRKTLSQNKEQKMVSAHTSVEGCGLNPQHNKNRNKTKTKTKQKWNIFWVHLRASHSITPH